MVLSWLIFGLFAVSVVSGILFGSINEVSTAMLEGASNAITLGLSLAGPISLWSALQCAMEHSGISNNIAKAFSPLLRRLGEIKRHDLFTDSTYHLTALPNGVLFARHSKGDRSLVGLFSTTGQAALVCVDVPDGDYVNRIDGSAVEVRHGRMNTKGAPIIFEVA